MSVFFRPIQSVVFFLPVGVWTFKLFIIYDLVEVLM